MHLLPIYHYSAITYIWPCIYIVMGWQFVFPVYCIFILLCNIQYILILLIWNHGPFISGHVCIYTIDMGSQVIILVILLLPCVHIHMLLWVIEIILPCMCITDMESRVIDNRLHSYPATCIFIYTLYIHL